MIMCLSCPLVGPSPSTHFKAKREGQRLFCSRRVDVLLLSVIWITQWISVALICQRECLVVKYFSIILMILQRLVYMV